MMIATPAIRTATLADAPQLSAFAAAAFLDAFGKDNKLSDIETYLGQAFTIERQSAEIEDSNSTILLAENVDEEGVQLMGYAHLAQGDPPTAVVGPVPIILKRFYVARQWHGRGVAQSLMKEVLAAARALRARTLCLCVWEHNPRAIAFYGKHGFSRVGEQTFVLGTDIQTDWVMARGIDDEQVFLSV